jgi:hypothetical protein
MRKENTTLITDHYKNPKTSLVIFHFEPRASELNTGLVHRASIENKDLYIFDNYFQKGQRDETKNYFETATYSRPSYSTADSGEKGEKPGYSMNTKERWSLFANPPGSIRELHQFLGILSHRLDAEITTAPWELCHQAMAVTPSVITNYHTEISHETMQLGKHRDSHPEKGMFFAIPVLYEEKGVVHDNCFENGAPGKPWVVSVMLYATAEHFLPEHQMGTVFYKPDGEDALKVNCLDGRFVLFEADLFHAAEESAISSTTGLWRISYVLKLIMNPKTRDQSVKKAFAQLFQDAQIVTTGSNCRL